MKRGILLAIFVCIGKLVLAQDEGNPNTFILGGTVSFQSQTNYFPISTAALGVSGSYSSRQEKYSGTLFSISPYVGKEISQRLTLGGLIRYQYIKQRREDLTTILGGQVFTYDLENKTHLYGLGMFSRHILNPANALQFFLQPAIEYSRVQFTETGGITTAITMETAYLFEIGVSAGAFYNINEWIRVTINLGLLHYAFGKWRNTNTEEEYSFSGFNGNLIPRAFSLGMEFRF